MLPAAASISDDPDYPSWVDHVHADQGEFVRVALTRAMVNDRGEEDGERGDEAIGRYGTLAHAIAASVADLVGEGSESVALVVPDADDFDLAQVAAGAAGRRTSILVVNGIEWCSLGAGDVVLPQWPPDHPRFVAIAVGDWDPHVIAGARNETLGHLGPHWLYCERDNYDICYVGRFTVESAGVEAVVNFSGMFEFRDGAVVPREGIDSWVDPRFAPTSASHESTSDTS